MGAQAGHEALPLSAILLGSGTLGLSALPHVAAGLGSGSTHHASFLKHILEGSGDGSGDGLGTSGDTQMELLTAGVSLAQP